MPDNNRSTRDGRSLEMLMRDCSMEVIEICDSLVDDSDALELAPSERQRLVELVEKTVQSDLGGWCELAGHGARTADQAFDRAVAIMEVAECTMSAYLAQKYGLSSETPLSWTPDFLPVRWSTAADRARAVKFLVQRRLSALVKDGHGLQRT